MSESVKWMDKEITHPLLRPLALVAVYVLIAILFIPSLLLTVALRAASRRGPFYTAKDGSWHIVFTKEMFKRLPHHPESRRAGA